MSRVITIGILFPLAVKKWGIGILSFVMVFVPSLLHADASLPFKPAFVPRQGWYSYVIAILALLAILMVLVKKKYPGTGSQKNWQVLDKCQLSQKTTLYIVEYQQQRFLVGDNQQSLSFLPLNEVVTHEH